MLMSRESLFQVSCIVSSHRDGTAVTQCQCLPGWKCFKCLRAQWRREDAVLASTPFILIYLKYDLTCQCPGRQNNHSQPDILPGETEVIPELGRDLVPIRPLR